MKRSILVFLLSFLVCSSVFARSTGCKEGNCDNGYGKWVYTDKTTYEGEWVATKKEGQGIETWPNGYIYKGANGFMNGQGTFTWADGKQKSGIWKNGKLQE